MKVYNLQIEDKLYSELEEIKENTGASIAYIIRRAIEEYIKELNKVK